MEIFNEFANGYLCLAEGTVAFSTIEWSKHPTFEGVDMKHIVTSKDTKGEFSYHLVRIAPNKEIGNHVHTTQLETHEVISGSGVCRNGNIEITYRPGTISILQMNVEHRVVATEEGLCLFAKFIPALC